MFSFKRDDHSVYTNLPSELYRFAGSFRSKKKARAVAAKLRAKDADMYVTVVQEPKPSYAVGHLD